MDAFERAAVVPYYDEFLLEPRYADADDSELDPYDWDTAWCAALAWSGRDEGAGGGQQKVEEMKFWAWYLEQAAQLMGIEGIKFPKKAIKDFEEKQELARPVPEEVTLETFTQFMGVGEYRFYIYTLSSGQGPHLGYEIHSVRQEREGICPKCGTRVTRAEFWYSVNFLDDILPQSGIPAPHDEIRRPVLQSDPGRGPAAVRGPAEQEYQMPHHAGSRGRKGRHTAAIKNEMRIVMN